MEHILDLLFKEKLLNKIKEWDPNAHIGEILKHYAKEEKPYIRECMF